MQQLSVICGQAANLTARFCLCCVMIVAWNAFPPVGIHAAEPPKVTILTTDGGVKFGILGEKPAKPAPTLIVLASSPEATLGSDYFLQCGVMLAKQGYLCVSLDLPCHGQQVVAGEPSEISGWRHRLDAGQDLLADMHRRSRAMLDYLIANGYSDPEKIAACGTSRGGFISLHIAADDKRIQCVAAIAPVTDPLVVREFKGMAHPERAAAVSVINLADALAGRGVWIVIGDRDERVSTDRAIEFARRLSAVAVEKNVPSQVELLVRSEPRGHTTPPGSAEQAAIWIAAQLKTGPAM